MIVYIFAFFVEIVLGHELTSVDEIHGQFEDISKASEEEILQYVRVYWSVLHVYGGVPLVLTRLLCDPVIVTKMNIYVVCVRIGVHTANTLAWIAVRPWTVDVPIGIISANANVLLYVDIFSFHETIMLHSLLKVSIIPLCVCMIY